MAPPKIQTGSRGDQRRKLFKIGTKYICLVCSKLYASRSGLGKHECSDPIEYSSDFHRLRTGIAILAGSMRRAIQTHLGRMPEVLGSIDALEDLICQLIELINKTLIKRT